MRILAAVLLSLLPCYGQGVPAVPVDGVPFVLRAFDNHSLVAVGDFHDMEELHSFIRTLVQSPRFPDAASEIVVEWGNSLYQDVADRYLVNGEMTPPESVSAIWRNTTQGIPSAMTGYPVWDSPVYQQFFETVRAVNLALPLARRIRVILADPPIDWKAVRTREDFSAWLDRREASFQSAMEQVLARKHKALVLIGEGHLYRLRSQPGSLTQIEIDRPGTTYLIVPHAGFGFQNSQLEPLVSAWPANSIAPVSGTTLGAVPAGAINFNAMFGPGGPQNDPFSGLLLQDILDAYLYLGTRDSLHEWKPYAYIYQDRNYWNELRRRSRIVSGQAFDPAGHGWDNRTRLFDAPSGAVIVRIGN